jgi:AmmeMemoRadiSam system protein A
MPMSPLPHNSSPAAAGSEVDQGEFSCEERTLLLRLAHDSISSALEQRQLPLEAPTPHLAEPCGVFTSLYLRHDSPKALPGNSRGPDRQRATLRGCVGYVLPTCSVYRAVAETARAAAFDDNRFSPVTREEADQLEIELSVLSPPQSIQAEEVEVGRHGLLISQHGRRGLLLPQVPVERGWDRKTFLEQTCRKAGLSLDAWQKGATIEAFTAEVFGEGSGKSGS